MKLSSLLHPKRITRGLAPRTKDEALAGPPFARAVKLSRDASRGVRALRGRRLGGSGSAGGFLHKITGSR